MRNTAKPADTASIGDIVFAKVRCDQLRDRVQKLKAAGGERYQPSALRDATDALRKSEEKFREAQRQEGSGLADATERVEKAVADADNAIMESRKRRSAEELALLEAKVAEALGDGALLHAHEMLNDVIQAAGRISACHARGDYDTVIAAVEMLKPKVDQLITMSRIDNVNQEMDRCEETMANLKAQGVAQKQADRYRAAERTLGQARDLFANNDFDGAKEKVSALREQLKQMSAAPEAQEE